MHYCSITKHLFHLFHPISASRYESKPPHSHPPPIRADCAGMLLLCRAKKWCGSFKVAEPPPAATQTARESIPPLHVPSRAVKWAGGKSREPRRYPHFLDTFSCHILFLSSSITDKRTASGLAAETTTCLGGVTRRAAGPAQRKRGGWAKARGDSTIDGRNQQRIRNQKADQSIAPKTAGV